MITVLGIDPGLTTGIALISWLVTPHSLLSSGLQAPLKEGVPDTRGRPTIRVGQVSPLLAVWIVEHAMSRPDIQALAIESFVESRHSNTTEGRATREVIAVVEQMAKDAGVMLTKRPAGAVKPWATDVRLNAAGLLAPTDGMRHARDACRHALFAAVRDLGGRDPLSKADER